MSNGKIFAGNFDGDFIKVLARLDYLKSGVTVIRFGSECFQQGDNRGKAWHRSGSS